TAFQDIPTALHAPSGSKREVAPPDRSLPARERLSFRPQMRQTERSRRTSLWRLRSSHLTVQPFLRRREAIQSGDGRGEIDRLPFRVKTRRLQPINPRKKVINKTRHTLIAVGRLWPIESDQNSRYRNR